MNTTKVIGGAVVVGALAVGAFELVTMGDEERPEIRVRGGSVVMESALAWKKDLIGQQWKPDQPEGENVNEFVVRVENPAAPCSEMRGGRVHVRFGTGENQRFEFYRQRKHGIFTLEPKVDSPDDLTLNNGVNPKTLTHTTATFSEVRVFQGQTSTSCSLSAQSVVTICMNACR